LNQGLPTSADVRYRQSVGPVDMAAFCAAHLISGGVMAIISGFA
jgi:hypothetical protein